MNDRERRVLERIEQELRRTDPAFVRKFTRTDTRRIGMPAVALVIGLVLMVFGSAIVSVAVAMLGIVIVGLGLFAAYFRRTPGLGFPGRA